MLAKIVLLSFFPDVEQYSWTTFASRQHIDILVVIYLYLIFTHSDHDGDITGFKFASG